MGHVKKTFLNVSASAPPKDAITNTLVEEARKKHLGSLKLDALYVDVVAQIGELKKQWPKALVKEALGGSSPLVKIARTLQQPLYVLTQALKLIGGMRGLISKALHAPPLKLDVSVLMKPQMQAARDNTYVAPKWRPR